ncbi:hypothetical protein JYU34_011742 [Plutella xylostella]|uniref:Uncharacterized protein n=1 Tax=Plutella xylostella TaxID=51655 RepID=A0ABQ7QES2_PLUXY|nr:hypothetical protein JYU34_011742 [Plutella xylostella]
MTCMVPPFRLPSCTSWSQYKISCFPRPCACATLAPRPPHAPPASEPETLVL